MHRSISSILVLGDGLLGSEIVKQTGWNYISRKKDKFDFNDISTYHNLLEGYDTIINCIANTNTYSTDKQSMQSTNYLSVINLVEYCLEKNAKLVHISTDYVYANSIPFASEVDLPLISPNWYTYYKLLADEYAHSKAANSLICRCSFKPNPFPYKSAWTDLTGNFDSVDTIASLIIKLIHKDACGIFNIGTETKTMYELAKRTNSEVQPILGPKEAPKDLTLNLERMRTVLSGS